VNDNIKIKMVEYFDDHFYKITFDENTVEWYPSVTTKLSVSPKPFLSRWRGDVGNREADLRIYDASNRGKRIHYACTVLVNNGAVILNPFECPHYSKEEIDDIKGKAEMFVLQDQNEMIQVNRFQKWLNRTGAKIICSDTVVYDDQYKEAGTLDFVFDIPQGNYEISGKEPVPLASGIYVVDLKSGNEVYDEAYMQISAYAKMYLQMHQELKDQFQGGLIIHTNSLLKSGIPGLKTHVRTKEEMRQDYLDFRNVAAVWMRTNKDIEPKYFEIPSLITMNESVLKENSHGNVN
jgi:hypothetical protein